MRISQSLSTASLFLFCATLIACQSQKANVDLPTSQTGDEQLVFAESFNTSLEDRQKSTAAAQRKHAHGNGDHIHVHDDGHTHFEPGWDITGPGVFQDSFFQRDPENPSPGRSIEAKRYFTSPLALESDSHDGIAFYATVRQVKPETGGRSAFSLSTATPERGRITMRVVPTEGITIIADAQPIDEPLLDRPKAATVKSDVVVESVFGNALDVPADRYVKWRWSLHRINEIPAMANEGLRTTVSYYDDWSGDEPRWVEALNATQVQSKPFRSDENPDGNAHISLRGDGVTHYGLLISNGSRRTPESTAIFDAVWVTKLPR